MSKKLFFAALVLLAGLAPNARAYDFSALSNGQTLYYHITDTSLLQVEVTYPSENSNMPYDGFAAPTGALVIPSTVENGGVTYTVTTIGYCAFNNCTGITSVSIPSTVTSIASYAFNQCTNIGSLTVPSTVTSISWYAFYLVNNIAYSGSAPWTTDGGGRAWGAKSRNGYMEGDFVYASAAKDTLRGYTVANANVTIPSTVTVIDTEAFMYCSELVSLTIPSSVTTISYYAFRYCPNLASVTIASSVTTIEGYAFADCFSIATLTIPDNVSTIGTYAFGNVCNIVYNGTATGSPWGARTRNGTVDGGFVFYDSAKHTLTGYVGTDSNIVIPSTVTTISYDAFHGNNTIVTVTIPSSVTQIRDNAFKECRNLQSITIPSSVTSMGQSIFNGCTSLTEPTLNNTSTTLPSETFYGCTSLASVTISPSITTIGGYAFYGCTSLASVTIPSSVTSIGSSAFRNCSSLTSIDIPATVTSISASAFYCSGLTSVTILGGTVGDYAFAYCSDLATVTIGDGVTTINGHAFYNCPNLDSVFIGTGPSSISYSAFYVDTVDYLFYNCSASVGSLSARHVVVGDHVTSIGSYAFSGSILETIDISNSVTSIGAYAFADCDSLKSVVIPNSVTSIGSSAFYGCTGLTAVVIPSSVTSIGSYAFSGCGMRYIELPVTVSTIGGYAFYGMKAVIYRGNATGAPWGAQHVAAAIENDFLFSDVNKTALACYIGDLTDLTIPESVVTINEEAFKNDTTITSVIIPTSVATISQRAFDGCTSLTSLAIPHSITSVGNYAFSNCTSLAQVDWNSDNTSLGYHIFEGCTNLTSFIFGDSVQTIPASVCSGCTGLTSIDIPATVTAIGVSAFYGCSGLTSLTIPHTVTAVGSNAFSYCSSLTHVNWNANITNLGNLGSNLFYASTDFLTSFVFGDSVQTIPENFCYNMSELVTVTIGSSVATVGTQAFYGCAALTETHYTGNVEQWLAISFAGNYSNPIANSHNLYLGDSLVTVLHIPEGVTHINNNFRDDTALTHVYISSTVNGISAYAFNGCAPSWFYFKPAIPPALASWQAFTYTTSSGQTYGSLMMVPWQSLQAYKTATNYTSFAQNLIYPDSCMLSVNINNTTLGTATLDGSSTLTHLYQLLDTATIVVTPTGNFYAEVTADGCTIIDTVNTNTYKVRFNRSNAYPTFTVNFIGNTHHVNAVANCANCGTVTGTNDYAYGATVTVEATAADGYYFVRWSDGSTANPATFVCHGDTTVTAIFSDIVTPELCMVSVQNDRNVLLWDTEDKPIASYTVYREGTVSGEYDAVATIPYAQAGQWTDDDSRPSSRSYRYRLTATDTCGNESEAGGIHKTMHLTISQGVGTTWNLVWTPYEGAEYTTYVIYRGTNASNIQQIDIMPSDGNTTYSDNSAPTGEVYYQVGVMMTTPCNDAKSASISRSNIASSEGGTQGIADIDENNVRVYAHDGRIVVEGADGETVRVYDIMGRLTQTIKQSDNQTIPTGVYMVKVGNLPARRVVVMQ